MSQKANILDLNSEGHNKKSWELRCAWTLLKWVVHMILWVRYKDSGHYILDTNYGCFFEVPFLAFTRDPILGVFSRDF